MPATTTPTIAIRAAAAEDAVALYALAALDSAAVPAGPVLMVDVDGTPRAAVSVLTGESVADPFYASAELVDLLRLRASLLARDDGADHSRRAHFSLRRIAA